MKNSRAKKRRILNAGQLKVVLERFAREMSTQYANLDQVNPGSVILSGEMMLRYMGWTEAADLIIKGMDGAISAKTVTYDFHRLMDGATKVKCSEFGEAVVRHM